jgi:hypothetical protein
MVLICTRSRVRRFPLMPNSMNLSAEGIVTDDPGVAMLVALLGAWLPELRTDGAEVESDPDDEDNRLSEACAAPFRLCAGVV